MLPLLLAMAVGQASAGPRPVAMVLDLKGRVTVQQTKGPAEAATIMQELYPGDRLVSGDGGGATLVFYGDEHRERVRPGAEATVRRGGCEPATAVERQGPEKAKAVHAGVRSLAESGTGAVIVFRTADEPPPAVMPVVGSTVVSDRPSFSWPPAAKARAYHVRLTVEGSDRLVWQAKTEDPRLEYPKKEPPLRRGRNYEWKVDADVGGDVPKAVAAGEFAVASEDDARDLAGLGRLAESKDPADLLLAAVAYDHYGAYGEALALYERLVRGSPAQGVLHAALSLHYQWAGRLKEAKREWKKAEDLGFDASPKERDAPP